jgi:hypothetical protein
LSGYRRKTGGYKYLPGLAFPDGLHPAGVFFPPNNFLDFTPWGRGKKSKQLQIVSFP